MSDEPKKRGSWGWIGWALLAVFVLYPLSMGPAWRIAPGSDFNVTMYSPVFWASRYCRPMGDAASQYLRLWGAEVYFYDSPFGDDD
ncbi:MAG TPA: hypothetical protein VG055_04410 [Planctomycetaceae bacterium]|jgi:hypothetical protein|nr:hypothetical protein [Planctomycetaceae bacterium]